MVQMVDCEAQDPNLKGKTKDSTDDAVMGDYWSPKLAPYAHSLISMILMAYQLIPAFCHL